MPSPASTAGRPQPVGAGRYPRRPRVDGALTGRTGATLRYLISELFRNIVAVHPISVRLGLPLHLERDGGAVADRQHRLCTPAQGQSTTSGRCATLTAPRTGTTPPQPRQAGAGRFGRRRSAFRWQGLGGSAVPSVEHRSLLGLRARFGQSRCARGNPCDLAPMAKFKNKRLQSMTYQPIDS
jgi:hypothetical protein